MRWIGFVLLGMALFPVVASAETISWVPVGFEGNPTDPSTGGVYGSVPTFYRIGKYETTNAQYAEFLNAKAANSQGSDTLALYNTSMGTDPRGGIQRTGDGTIGSPYVYATRPNMHDKPVNFVGIFDAMRYANWLNNGGGDSETEDGSYTLLGGTAVPSNSNTVQRNSAARIFLPSENEWYKAAYFEPGASQDNYWRYPTRSDQPPVAATADALGNIANPGANVANYDYMSNWNGQIGNVTTVGSAGPESEGFFGTADMAGNVYEMTDTIFHMNMGLYRARGGSFADGEIFQRSSIDGGVSRFFEGEPAIGFRIASVPEPGTLHLAALGCGLAMIGVIRNRRKTQDVRESLSKLAD